MITGKAAKGILVGSVMVAALIGFTGCAKKAQMQPAAEEIGGAEEAYRAPAAPGTGGPGAGLSEESLRAKARAELEAQLQRRVERAVDRLEGNVECGIDADRDL